MTDTYNDGKCNGILENLTFSQQQRWGEKARNNLPDNYQKGQVCCYVRLDNTNNK